jgi:hypothetical protein
MLINWLEPWGSVQNPEVFEKELYREVGQQHILYGKKVIAIGARCDCDDCLFEVLDSDFRFAVVHLTYSKEENPNWPDTEIYKDIDTWIKERMMADHEEFNY